MTKIAIAIIKTIMNKVLKANIKATHLPDMRVGPSGTINMVTNFPLTRIYGINSDNDIIVKSETDEYEYDPDTDKYYCARTHKWITQTSIGCF